MSFIIVFETEVDGGHFDLIEIDGSQKSGSGTILRLGIALAAIRREALHVCNIRENRPQPGLRPQHLEAVLTAAELCDAKTDGATIGSRELWFRPGEVREGRFNAEIGTAGSISMLLLTVLPICAFAADRVEIHVSKGGTDVLNSPTINYVRFVFLPILQKLGLETSLSVTRYGYYPKGNGEVTMSVMPCRLLGSLRLGNFGNVERIEGISVCTGLADRHVAERQARAASDFLRDRGYVADVKIIDDTSNKLQKGSSIVLWAETDTGAIIGSDAIGEPKKSSEDVGIESAQKLLTELKSRVTVDIHLADLLVPFVALAKGRSEYLVRFLSEHLETNVWLCQKILDAEFSLKKMNNTYKIEKMS